MNRRRFLIASATALVNAACVTSSPTDAVKDARPLSRAESITGWRQRIHAILARGRLPIIDTEATYNPARYDIEFIRSEMDRNDVAQIAFAPIFQSPGGAISSLELHRRYPAYFIPTTSDGVTRHWFDNSRPFVDTATAEIRSGEYFFMGEHELRHYPSPLQAKAGRADRDITIPLDSPAVQALFRFSEESGAAFQIHYEIEDALLPPLEALLARYPRARVIWCHLGQIRYPGRSTIYGPAYVRRLIERFPNLHFDLGLPGPPHVYPPSGARDMTIYEFTGIHPPYGGFLKKEWRDLLNEHPERFLAASDIDGDRFREFPRAIARLRYLVLDQLDERARHLVAYRNAWRLIVREEWSG
jgi:hypothetical protein